MIPPPQPKGRRVQKSVSLPAGLWKGLIADAKRSSVTVSQLIEHIGQHYLRERERDAGSGHKSTEG